MFDTVLSLKYVKTKNEDTPVRWYTPQKTNA